jgi:hypothetical protein
MSIAIRNRWSNEVIKTVEGDTLKCADLSYANLRGSDLSYANLRGANLCGSNLSYANLCDANLCDANLSYANLYGSNLRGANLRGSDLSYANLYGSNLSCANLCDAKRYIDGDEVIMLRGPRPILTLGPLGSRNDYMMGLITSAGLRVECGCFCGTLDEFKAAVERKHANNPRHRDEYLAVCRMIKAWAKVEAKYVDAWEKENPISAEDGGPK